MTIEQPEPRGRELHDVHVLVAGVVVEREADLVAVERDGAVDVADGEEDDLERPVHDVLRSVCRWFDGR